MLLDSPLQSFTWLPRSTLSSTKKLITTTRNYVICGDGCLQEGSSSETSSLAGHVGLGGLIVLHDDSLITIDGSTDLCFTEDIQKRYESYGWQVLVVEIVEQDLKDLRAAIVTAKANKSKPTLIKIRTSIGKGSSLEGCAAARGAPLKRDDLSQATKGWGLPDEPFTIADEVRSF